MSKQNIEIEQTGIQSGNGSVSRQNPGLILQAAREDAGLSCEQLAQLLHLTQATVLALEQGHFESLRGSTYVRGYLRNYCQQVNLAPQSILELYDNYIKPVVVVDDQAVDANEPLSTRSELARPESSSKAPPVTYSLHQQHKMGYGIAVAVILGAYIFWSNTGNDVFVDESDILNLVKVETAQGVTIVGPFAEYDGQDEELDVDMPLNMVKAVDLEKYMKSQINNSAGQMATAETQAMSNDQVEVKAETTEPVIAIKNITFENISFENNESDISSQLSFYFTDDCWVEVQDGNSKLIFSKLARAEESLKLEGVPPFQVKLGYAPGVSLSYNGESVPIRSSRESKTVELTLGSS